MNINQYEDKINKKFLPLFKAKEEILVSVGGAASGKTISVFQKAILDAINIPEYKCLVVKKGKAGVSKVSTWPSLLMAAEILGVKGQFDTNIIPLTIQAGNNIIDCMEYKTFSDIRNYLNCRRVGCVIFNHVIVEDAHTLTEAEFAVLFAGRNLRQITLVLNPILDKDEKSWIKAKLYNQASYFGNSVFTVHSTYKDNEFLDENHKSSLDNMGSLNTGYESVYKFGDWAAIN